MTSPRDFVSPRKKPTTKSLSGDFLFYSCPAVLDKKKIKKWLHATLGLRPRKLELYQIALTHKSLSSDVNGHKINNERLEFLGDAVLDLVVGNYLYQRYPFQGEGFLTEMRCKIVSRASLNELASKIGLNEQMIYDRSHQNVGKCMGGNGLEALIGAVYLDRGYRRTNRFIVKKLLNRYMDISSIETKGWNYKGKLIDWGQRHHKKITFEVARTIKANRRSPLQYEVNLLINDRKAETATHDTIKQAEQLAAEKAFLKIQARETKAHQNKE